MTDWLSDSEQRIWRAFLSANRKLQDHLGRDLQSKHNLSLADYEIMVRLSESSQRRMRMSDLADVTLSSRSRLSHQVDRMVKAGLLEREDCPDDRRGLFAVLTTQGFASLQKAAPDHVEGVRAYFLDLFSERELATIGKLCGKVDDGLDGPGV
ncbi:MAG: MarR family winged helix-turn-helix transcriptional regulator [Candidatus Nanopelagicales bacterium]